MGKPQKVCLSRDEINQHDVYQLWTTKPRKNGSGGFISSGKSCLFIKIFCAKELESITGFSLKPGNCKRVTIEIKLV